MKRRALRLHRETLRVLSSDALTRVAGGAQSEAMMCGGKEDDPADKGNNPGGDPLRPGTHIPRNDRLSTKCPETLRHSLVIGCLG